MVLLASITNHLSERCRKFLLDDGITSLNFTLAGQRDIFEGFSLDARAAKKNQPALGETFSIAKNLDEYQNKICSMIPSLVDKNPAKMHLQKCRIGIVAAFAKLVSIIKTERRTEEVAEWNWYARLILEDASNTYVSATTAPPSEQKRYTASLSEAFSFFGVPEEKIDVLLNRMYGGNNISD
jgi:hypothetical protein